jgi:hypothetical protein
MPTLRKRHRRKGCVPIIPVCQNEEVTPEGRKVFLKGLLGTRLPSGLYLLISFSNRKIVSNVFVGSGLKLQCGCCSRWVDTCTSTRTWSYSCCTASVAQTRHRIHTLPHSHVSFLSPPGFGFFLVLTTQKARWLGALALGAFAVAVATFQLIPSNWIASAYNITNYTTICVIFIIGVFFRTVEAPENILRNKVRLFRGPVSMIQIYRKRLLTSAD